MAINAEKFHNIIYKSSENTNKNKIENNCDLNYYNIGFYKYSR